MMRQGVRNLRWVGDVDGRVVLDMHGIICLVRMMLRGCLIKAGA